MNSNSTKVQFASDVAAATLGGQTGGSTESEGDRKLDDTLRLKIRSRILCIYGRQTLLMPSGLGAGELPPLDPLTVPKAPERKKIKLGGIKIGYRQF